MRGDTKSHIIKVASELFYKNGYNSTGINEIIREANIAKATLYNHFKSKDEVCLAYLQSKHSQFIVDLEVFVNHSSTKKNRILLLFDFLKSFYNSKGFNGCWCIKTYAEIPSHKTVLQKEIRKQKLELLDFIKSILKEDLKINSPKKLQQKAAQIYLIYEGAVAESHIHNEEWPIQSAIEISKLIIA